MKTHRATYTYKNSNGELRTVTLTVDGSPTLFMGDPLNYLRFLVGQVPVHVTGPVEVPDESEAGHG